MRGHTTHARDVLAEDEPLEDQSGTDQLLTFTFSTAVDLVHIYIKDARGRASATANPTATKGFYCDQDTGTYFPVRAASVKVHLIGAGIVSVTGLRYA